jgi:hypothetical protein
MSAAEFSAGAAAIALRKVSLDGVGDDLDRLGADEIQRGRIAVRERREGRGKRDR